VRRRAFSRLCQTAAAGVTAVARAGLAAGFLLPVWFMIAGSFKPNDRVLAAGASWRALWSVGATLGNYDAVLHQLNFLRFLGNSLFIVGTIVVVGLVVNSMAGYALSRLRWRGREAVLALVVAILIIPYEVIAVPLFFEMTLAGWTNSYRVQIVPFLANPFAIYLFYTFFNGLPKELDEAARMDGAGPVRTFFLVIAPLAKPAYAAVAILTFLLQWGFFLWPLMVTRGPAYQPLPVALGYFSANKPVQWGNILAFGTLMVAPVLVVFLVFQKWFVRGIAMSGLKG
jgi:multiple sugar transport system permease protein